MDKRWQQGIAEILLLFHLEVGEVKHKCYIKGYISPPLEVGYQAPVRTGLYDAEADLRSKTKFKKESQLENAQFLEHTISTETISKTHKLTYSTVSSSYKINTNHKE